MQIFSPFLAWLNQQNIAIQWVIVQIKVTCVVGLIGFLIGGAVVGGFGVLGGLCSTIPNMWFAWYLILRKAQKTPITFFVGELIKIALTIVLLVVVVRVFKQIHWLAFIVGFVVVLKSYLILLLRKRL